MRDVRLDAVIHTESGAEENISSENNNNNNNPVIDPDPSIRFSANFPLKILTFFFRNFEDFCSEVSSSARLNIHKSYI